MNGKRALRMCGNKPSTDAASCSPAMTRFVIEKAIATKQIDLLAFAQDAGNEVYAEAIMNTKKKSLVIDLSAYSDKELIRALAEFYYGLVADGTKRFSHFKDHYYYGFGIIAKKQKDEPCSEYSLQDYLNSANALKRTGDHAYPERVFINRFATFVAIRSGRYSTFESDIWDLRLMNISSERINPARSINELHFERIEDPDDKVLIKQYIYYLLTTTDCAIYTISQRLSQLRSLLSTSQTPFHEWDVSDVNAFLEKYSDREKGKRELFFSGSAFADYLALHQKMENGNPFLLVDYQFQKNYHYKFTSPDMYIICQTFSKLDQMNSPLAMIAYLIMKCTGARISDVAGIKKDCLSTVGDACFIRLYIPKMRKTVENNIPPLLYEKIDAYRKTLPVNEQYLFPSGCKPNAPIRASSLSRLLIREFNRLGIIQLDGSPYHFTAHSYRHLMGHRMLEAGIPLQFISEQLHHRCPDMTFVYIEYTDRRSASLAKTCIDRTGRDAVLDVPVTLTDDDLNAEMLRKAVYAQMLPNGMCARPIMLGKCEHAHKCLDCPSFRTSSEFLPVFENQKRKTEKYLEFTRVNGMEKQAADCEKDLEKITFYIKQLSGKEA